MSRPTLVLSLRIDFARAGDTRIGPGKIALLEAIGVSGSIAGGGRILGMSYRRAWTLIDAMNQMFDSPVVEASAGGKAGGGATLTPFGAEIVAAYRAFEAKMAACAQSDLSVMLERLVPPQPGSEAG